MITKVKCLTNKLFKAEDGWCRVYVAHIHRGVHRSIEEFATHEQVEVYVRHLKRCDMSKQVHVNVIRCVTMDNGNSWWASKSDPKLSF